VVTGGFLAMHLHAMTFLVAHIPLNTN